MLQNGTKKSFCCRQVEISNETNSSCIAIRYGKRPGRDGREVAGEPQPDFPAFFPAVTLQNRFDHQMRGA